jgi:SAM-dependent methyltransferase
MQNKFVSQILDNAKIYNLTQNIFAPGSRQLVTDHISTLLDQVPRAERLLDVGCGPQSWLWQVGISPVGLDITYSYCEAYHNKKEPVITASSANLPFVDGSFGGVWSVGMFHHLSDAIARQAILEMDRVCKADGYLAIIDAVLPVTFWRNPLAYAIRKRDRGKFVRSQANFEALLPEHLNWYIKRAKYSQNGLEVMVCWVIKS